MALRDHLEKFHYFFEVAKAGSFKEAAQNIAITQPSLTKSIQVLENSIDKKLFNRKARGVNLTQEGELLYIYCHKLFSQLNDLEIRLNSPDDPMAGSLRVGTYDSIAIFFWPQFLREFLSRYPKLNLELTTGRSQQIQNLVEKGELDLGMIVEPKETINANTIELARDCFQLYCSNQISPNYESLHRAPIIYMPDALAGAEHSLLRKALPTLKDSQERIEYHTSSLESAKELVINGIGVGLLPTIQAQEDVRKGLLKKVELQGFPKEGIGPHRIGLVYSRYREDSETLINLIEALKAVKL